MIFFWYCYHKLKMGTPSWNQLSETMKSLENFCYHALTYDDGYLRKDRKRKKIKMEMEVRKKGYHKLHDLNKHKLILIN